MLFGKARLGCLLTGIPAGLDAEHEGRGRDDKRDWTGWRIGAVDLDDSAGGEYPDRRACRGCSCRVDERNCLVAAAGCGRHARFRDQLYGWVHRVFWQLVFHVCEVNLLIFRYDVI